MNRTMKYFWETLRRYWNRTDRREAVNQLFMEEGICKQNESSKSVELGELLQEYLNTGYDFRYNRLTEETEFRPHRQTNLAYLPIDHRKDLLCDPSGSQSEAKRVIAFTSVPPATKALQGESEG